MANPSAAGLYRVCDDTMVKGLALSHLRVLDAILESVAALRGPETAERLREAGLGALHREFDVAEVGNLRDRVLEKLRHELLQLGAQVGRQVLGWQDDFYIDDYLILRINFPYEVARFAPATAENPGIGRVSPQVRELAAARRVQDPVYDPKSYHRGHPPAAWAHGPHIDS